MRRHSLALIVLPAIHILLFALLLADSATMGASAALWTDLPISLPLVARDDLATEVGVGILATGWWFFGGWVGWSSKKCLISRTASALGAGLVLFTGGIGGYALTSGFLQFPRDQRLSPQDVLMYLLAAALLGGGLIAAVHSAIAALTTAR